MTGGAGLRQRRQYTRGTCVLRSSPTKLPWRKLPWNQRMGNLMQARKRLYALVARLHPTKRQGRGRRA
jgi:hypothetical protein